ncbi:CAP domain-containing protein [Halorubrum vacuolatum]|uniref:CAP domain-containing protein n=1 Tax=Halorubrum vacuolatum TaxID=63740 RepID=UPI003743CD52
MFTGSQIHPSRIERAIHQRTNHERRERELCELQFDYHLSAVALRHSRDMSHRNYFAHESPEGKSPADRYEAASVDSNRVGENLSKQYHGPSTSPSLIGSEVVDAWLGSPGHRKTLLEFQWSREGIGVFVDVDGAIYITQNFA